VKLLADFTYIDNAGDRWTVPRDATVDGASIPRMLWTPLGGPMEGEYRDASIVHDWYCDLRSRPWKCVHRMFYEAMLASGVGLARAKIMYAGVYFGGPRWSETVESNVALMAREYLESSNAPEKYRRLHFPMPVIDPGDHRRGPYAENGRTRVVKRYHYTFEAFDKTSLEEHVTADSSLEAIENMIDQQTTNRSRVSDGETRDPM
jgi:hypothetical protein